MIARVVEAHHAGQFRVWLKFDDGLSGVLDLADQLWGPVFEPLKDVAVFSQVRVDPDTETITWPNGADLSPSWLYEKLKATRESTLAAK